MRQTRQIGSLGLQILVFSLVSASFTMIYLVQPVLPVIQSEFGVDVTLASYTISAVVLGIALSNLPFGRVSDLYPIKPVLAAGGFLVSALGLLCAVTREISLLILLRFCQGIFIPALTTSLAAYLSRTLPRERLNVVMGSYVSATVVGGLGGRLLGGWIHPPLHWRYAFVTASALVFAATVMVLWLLPREEKGDSAGGRDVGFVSLLTRVDLLRIYVVAFSAFFVFSSLFNYLPFYLSGAPFQASTERITLMYLVYVIGVVIAPLSGKVSNRYGNGTTMVLGALVLGASLLLTHVQMLSVVWLALLGACAGFFSIHASAVGSMNRRLTAGRGRANSLYILFYYLGGSVGITVSGYLYEHVGWRGPTLAGVLMLAVILCVGIKERGATDPLHG